MQANSMTKLKKRIHREEEKRFGFRVSGFGKANPRHSFSSINCVRWNRVGNGLCRNSKPETRNAFVPSPSPSLLLQNRHLKDLGHFFGEFWAFFSFCCRNIL
jgi:hypothetical protein